MKKSSLAEADNKPAGLKIDIKTIIPVTVLLFALMLGAGVLTQVIAPGEYRLDASGSIINGTYRLLDGFRLPFWRVLVAPLQVFTSSEAAVGIAVLVFIVLVGGTFMILDRCGVLKYIMSSIVSKYAKSKYKLLAVIILACMALSSVAGILEESITIVPLAVAISLALGWDSLTGLGISLVSIAFGYTAATFNPFNVGVVQGLSGIPLFSGLWFRVLVFAAVYGILTPYIIFYAKRIEKDPKRSIVYESDLKLRERLGAGNGIDEEVLHSPKLKKATKIFVLCLSGVLVATALSFLLASVKAIPESVKDLLTNLPLASMALLFTLGGILAGRAAGFRGKKLLGTFFDGVKAIAPCVPMIILVMSITYVLKQGKIIHTILYFIYERIEGYPPYASLMMIFAFIMLLEFIIGSGTAKAFLIMPIIMPLADLLSIQRQTVVVAFSMSDGFGNILYPTSGVMIIAIGLAGVSYGKYLRWSWKLFALAFALSAGALAVALAVGYH